MNITQKSLLTTIVIVLASCSSVSTDRTNDSTAISASASEAYSDSGITSNNVLYFSYDKSDVNSEGRMKIAEAFNNAIADGTLSAPVVLGRDHHDVSGTDSPYRETSNIYDGSQFTADMAIQNVIGDSFRGATWVSIHNGGGVGWGEVINGGFGMLIDGSADSDRKLKSMLFWDVNNGISRRSWARNKEANFAIKRAMKMNPDLKITMPNSADDNLINSLDL